jgi:hypothetical protein
MTGLLASIDELRDVVESILNRQPTKPGKGYQVFVCRWLSLLAQLWSSI